LDLFICLFTYIYHCNLPDGNKFEIIHTYVYVSWYAWVTEDGESGLRCLANMLLANVWRFDFTEFYDNPLLATPPHSTRT